MDNKRLLKQIVEGNQILKTLLTGSDSSSGWKNHPAVLQWKGYEKVLHNYISFCLMEAHKRGFKTDKSLLNLNELNEAYNDKLGFKAEFLWPPWLGNDAFHSSHRSRLLFKGRVDSVSGQLKGQMGVRSINTWLLQNGYPEKNLFKTPNIEKLEGFCRNLFDLKIENHYAFFGWTEPDSLEYFWPVKLNG